ARLGGRGDGGAHGAARPPHRVGLGDRARDALPGGAARDAGPPRRVSRSALPHAEPDAAVRGARGRRVVRHLAVLVGPRGACPVTSLLESFHDKQVLITGGLGFLGSNLAIRLVALGARVTLLNAMLDNHGGNVFKVGQIHNTVTKNWSNIRDERHLKDMLTGNDYIS